MSPKDASKEMNPGRVNFNSSPNETKGAQKTKYKKGDQACISKYKRHFEKGYTPNWTEEIFVVDKINSTTPVTYQVRDLNDEKILGSFYTQELSPAKQTIFRTEKIIRRDYKNNKALGKWVGYND